MAQPVEVHVRRVGDVSSGAIVSSHASAQTDPQSFPIMDNHPDFVAFKTRDTGATEDQAVDSLRRNKTLWAALLAVAESSGMTPGMLEAETRTKRRGL